MVTDHTFSNTAAKSLLELLQSQERFMVPRFQRNYSWKKDQVDALWCDLLDNYHAYLKNGDNEPQYLLGSIVLVGTDEPRSFHVIDGQQRLATLTLLFCVARDIIQDDIKKTNRQKPEGFDKIIELIENTKMGKHIGYKVELNDTDRIYFRKIQEFDNLSKTQITTIKKSKPKIKSQKYIKENYLFLYEKITEALCNQFKQEHISNYNKMDDSEKERVRQEHHSDLLQFLMHVRENNYFIRIMVNDDSSAFQIFETLNARGQELSRSNLIKNYILKNMRNDEQQRENSDRWNKIFDDIVGPDYGDDDFIIDSYRSRCCEKESIRTNSDTESIPMSKKNLYKIIKRLIKDDKSCIKFIEELEEDAKFLSTLGDLTNYVDDSTRDDINAINMLKAQFIRRPILAAYRKWYDDRPKDYSELVKILLKFFFKIRTVREIHPGKVEENLEKITMMINEDHTLADIKQKIVKDLDDHKEFIRDFKSRFMPEPGRDAAKYALQQITIRLGTKYDDVMPIKELTLEHILPQNPNPDVWRKKDFFGRENEDDDIEKSKIRLGNMTLLKHAINAKLQNESFLEKRDHVDKDGVPDGYNSSKLQINIETVCTEDKWTVDIIQKRENRFAELADAIWKIE